MPHIRLSRRQLLTGLGAAGLTVAACRAFQGLWEQHFVIPRPIIIGLDDQKLYPQQIDDIQIIKPIGFLFYQRNISNRSQLRTFIEKLRDICGYDIITIIDQEGGSVLRMTPPQWVNYPAPPSMGIIARQNMEDAKRITYLTYRLIARDMKAVGLNTNAAPLLDVQYSTNVNRNTYRSFGPDHGIVTALGHVACDALLEGGIIPVIKHIPGQGRAITDSDRELTNIPHSHEELEADWAIYKSFTDMPMAMTSIATFNQLDNQTPVVFSSKGIEFIRNKLGYKGLLLTDDICIPSIETNIFANISQSLVAGNDIALCSHAAITIIRKLSGNMPAPNPAIYQRAREALLFAAKKYIPCDESALRSELADFAKKYCLNMDLLTPQSNMSAL